jgi:hypothetical protein
MIVSERMLVLLGFWIGCIGKLLAIRSVSKIQTCKRPVTKIPRKLKIILKEVFIINFLVHFATGISTVCHYMTII